MINSKAHYLDHYSDAKPYYYSFSDGAQEGILLAG